MGDRTNQMLGNYRLLRLLGRGGFAEVYLGEHVYLKTQAAIKVLHAQLTSESKEHFLAEAQTIAHLLHPNIVHVLDFGFDEQTPFLVMDYAPHGTLRQRHLRGIALPLALIVSYTKQIAAALQYAHDQKLIHRDVKPENMLLGRANEVLLSDFGIATISQTSRSLHTQDVSGTIAYMAPEQIQGKPRAASDQYSLAVIVYEWLTGRCPFQGAFAEIASQHVLVTPPSLRELYPAIPEEIEQVVMIALAKNPEGRFARVEAFANALEQASRPGLAPTIAAGSISGDSFFPPTLPAFVEAAAPRQTDPHAPIEQERHTPPYPAMPAMPLVPGASGAGEQLLATVTAPGVERQRGVSRRAMLFSLLGTAALVGGGTAWYFLSHQISGSAVSSPTPGIPSTPGATTTPAPTADPSPGARPSPASVNGPLVFAGPDQEFTVSWPRSGDGQYIASAGVGGMIQVWDSRTKAPHLSINTGAPQVFRVAWSPDGTKIAAGDGNGQVTIWNAFTGANLQTIQADSKQVNCVSWSPDGASIAAACSAGKNVTLWDVTSGTRLSSYAYSHYVNAVAWSPDGSRIAFGGGDTVVQVVNLNPSGNAVQTYTEHTDIILTLAWSPDGKRIASGSADTTVRIWDAATQGTYGVYREHTETILAVDWSPDGSKIVSGSIDTTVRVWNAFTQSRIRLFTDHTNKVEGVAWSPDNLRVASASRDTMVMIWSII